MKTNFPGKYNAYYDNKGKLIKIVNIFRENIVKTISYFAKKTGMKSFSSLFIKISDVFIKGLYNPQTNFL